MIVKVLSALAETSRLEAIGLLADGSEHGICELSCKLGAMQSRMARHMQPLRRADLDPHGSDTHRVGYRINTGLSPHLARLVEAMLDQKLAVGEAVA
jgi:ArsR family transcriptional regulator